MKLKNLGNIRSLEIFFMLAWNFWYRKKKWIHENIELLPNESIEHALVLYKRFKEVHPIPTPQLRK